MNTDPQKISDTSDAPKEGSNSTAKGKKSTRERYRVDFILEFLGYK